MTYCNTQWVDRDALAPMSLITVYEHQDEFQCVFYCINADHDIRWSCQGADETGCKLASPHPTHPPCSVTVNAQRGVERQTISTINRISDQISPSSAIVHVELH